MMFAQVGNTTRFPIVGVENLDEVVQGVAALFPMCKVVHGRVRHSQSQGSVERLNQVVERFLNKLLSQNGSAARPEP